MHGGLKATFFASYVHTTVIFLMLLIFTFTVYGSAGDGSGLYGSPGAVYDGLEKAALHAFYKATSSDGMTHQFSSIGSFIQNDGTCYSGDATSPKNTQKRCHFTKLDRNTFCCTADQLNSTLSDNSYCRPADKDCIDVSKSEHYQSSGCDEAAGERCVSSFVTMGSPSGLLFGITNIVGNFGTVFVDQSYWQSAVAAKPKSAVLGFLIGGMVWFAVPFCMATTNGLAGRALTTHPTIAGGALYIDAAASGSGLTPARALAHILGSGGAFILLLQLFMAITSTGSAEIIAVSSILTYDIYYEYINPELRERREELRAMYMDAVSTIAVGGNVALSSISTLVKDLVARKFFTAQPSEAELSYLAEAVGSFAVDGQIKSLDLYSAMNRVVSSSNNEGKILLRVSKFFTAVFAIFMGFLAVFLQTLGFSLGWVYMSMGVIIGSAVGPASLTILMKTANGKYIGAGAVGGLILGLLGWIIKAQVDNGEVNYGTLGQDWPWVVGNLCAIGGGFLIAGVGSLIDPDTTFEWEMLNERIPLVDDVQPPKDSEETDEKLQKQVTIAVVASVALTIILLVLWPIPMHASTGVLTKGGFTGWVVVEILWALVGGIVIIGLPAYETLSWFRKSQPSSTGQNKLPENSFTISLEAEPVKEP